MKYFSAKQIYSERKNLKGTIYRANREKWMRLNDFKGTIIELVTQKKYKNKSDIQNESFSMCVWNEQKTIAEFVSQCQKVHNNRK